MLEETFLRRVLTFKAFHFRAEVMLDHPLAMY
jgi:hypothetical protein